MNRTPAVAAVGIALILLAASFGLPAMYVPGVALALLAGAAWVTVALAARRARLVRAPSRATVEEDAPLQVELRLERGLLPLPGQELLVGSEAAPLRLHQGIATVERRFPRRGRHLVEPARLRVRDPLGMCTREIVSAPLDVLVLPRVEPVEAAAGGTASGVGRQARRAAVDLAAIEVDSLRPYRVGAPASRIHWPTVARTAELIERRLSDEAERLPMIVVDPRRPASEEALDRALRAAASLCVHLARSGGCWLLLPGDRRAQLIDPDLASWPMLHARLALVSPGAVPALAGAYRAAVILWVVASTGASPAGLARAGAGERYLVTPFPTSGRQVLFTVAGCTGQRLRTRAAA